jgi:hypothetical protein
MVRRATARKLAAKPTAREKKVAAAKAAPGRDSS